MRFAQVCTLCILALSAVAMAPVASAMDRINFQLDWIPGGDKAPVYVGVKEGFFKQAGLDVTITPGRGSNDALSRLASGQADIGLTDITALMIARARDHMPVQAFQSEFTEAPHAFFVLSNSPIKSVKDVAGKTFATSPFTSSNYFLPLVLAKNGLPTNSVKLQRTDPSAQLAMLLTGQVDGVISWVTDYASYQAAAKSTGRSIRMMPWYHYGLETYSTSLVASQKYLQAHPDRIKRFAAAYTKAVQFTFAHPQKAAADVASFVPGLNVDIAAQTIQQEKALVYNAISQRDGMGNFTKGYLDSTWQLTAKAQGINATTYDPQSTVAPKFLAKAP